MTNYFYDTEFLEDGKTIELISIGIVCEDGREFYAVNSEMPVQRIRSHAWLTENVWPQLPLSQNIAYDNSGDYLYADLDYNHPNVMTKDAIADSVEDFLLSGLAFPDLWAWFSAYDHVALAQLWGPMMELPHGIPMYTNDLRSLEDWVGAVNTPKQGNGVHNALEDARFNKVRYDYLMSLKEKNA